MKLQTTKKGFCFSKAIQSGNIPLLVISACIMYFESLCNIFISFRLHESFEAPSQNNNQIKALRNRKK